MTQITLDSLDIKLTAYLNSQPVNPTYNDCHY